MSSLKMAQLWFERLANSHGMDINLTGSHDYPVFDENLLHLAHKLYIYYVPVIICFGVACGMLMCVVLLRTKLKKRFFSHIFAAVAICDIGFLVTIMLIWVNDQVTDLYKAPGLCQVVIFMSHFFPFLSFWHSISACLIMMIRTRCDYLTNMCGGSGKARTLVISLSIFTFTVYIYKTWTNGVLIARGTRFCTVLPETERIMRILNIFDVFVLLVIPFLIFVAFDVWLVIVMIMRCIYGAQNIRHRFHGDSLKIIFCHSILFHIFVGPGCVSKLKFIMFSILGDESYDFEDLLIENIFQYFFYTYFALKPIVHLSVSRTFRIHLKKLVFKAKELRKSRLLLNSASQEQTLL